MTLRLKDKWTNNEVVIDKSKTFNFYLCGPDVYDHIHVGNARPIITYDVLIRLLNELHIKHKYVHNITDVADKIVNAAKELNTSEYELSEKYYKLYLDIFKRLNLILPNEMPKVTDNMDSIIDFVQEQINKGSAYKTPNAVMFSHNFIPNSRSIEQYSAYDLEEELNEFNQYKKDPRDFMLWKVTNKCANWKSPWGEGRPGWNTECACFVNKYFDGQTITMHSGGKDLEFPHHMCENAQFNSISHRPMSNVWNYVGHIHIDGEKMSKSLKNTVTAIDFITKYSVNALKYIIFSHDKDATIDFTKELIDKAVAFDHKLKEAIKHGLTADNHNKENIINALSNNLNIKQAFHYLLEDLNNNKLSNWEVEMFGLVK